MVFFSGNRVSLLELKKKILKKCYIQQFLWFLNGRDTVYKNVVSFLFLLAFSS